MASRSMVVEEELLLMLLIMIDASLSENLCRTIASTFEIASEASEITSSDGHASEYMSARSWQCGSMVDGASVTVSGADRDEEEGEGEAEENMLSMKFIMRALALFASSAETGDDGLESDVFRSNTALSRRLPIS